MKAKKISPHVAPGQLAWLEALAAFEQDLFAHGRSRATVATYASAVRTFGQFYCTQLGKPGPYVSRLHAADLHAFIDHLGRERQLSAASVNRFVAALHSFVRCGLAHKWLRRDIARKLRTYCDSGGKSNLVFGLARLLNIELNPRPRSRNMKLWAPSGKRSYEHLAEVFAGTIRWKFIDAGWVDMMWVLASLAAGTAPPALIFERLANQPKHPATRGFEELGKLDRSNYLLR